MTSKKDLYLGKSLKELNALADKKNVKKIAEKQCRMLVGYVIFLDNAFLFKNMSGILFAMQY